MTIKMASSFVRKYFAFPPNTSLLSA